eukprot:GHVP01053796.1.p1 GENE.GHVP01053796.1~~GHVP01053796.1.p1  ORF type:complete len:659 (+),score=91.11 GHVP01053796.1:50-2026(+)
MRVEGDHDMVFKTKLMKDGREEPGSLLLEDEKMSFKSKNKQWYLCFPYLEIRRLLQSNTNGVQVDLCNGDRLLFDCRKEPTMYTTLNALAKKDFNQMFVSKVKQKEGVFYGGFRMFRNPIMESISFWVSCEFKDHNGLFYVSNNLVFFHREDIYLTIKRNGIIMNLLEGNLVEIKTVCGASYIFQFRSHEDLQKIEEELQNTETKPYTEECTCCVYINKTLSSDIWENGSRDKSKFWNMYSGAEFLKDDSYWIIVDQTETVDVITRGEIEKDVIRSQITNSPQIESERIDSIRRILLCYCALHPETGYAQSMNMIVAFLLIYMKEEDAFWVFESLCEQFFPFHYSNNLIGALAEQIVVEELLKREIPAVHRKFAVLDIELSAITFGWIVSLFTSSFPVELTTRIMDCICVSGRDSISFIILAIMKLCENGFCKCQEAENVTSVVKDILSELKNDEMKVKKLFRVAYTYYKKIDWREVENIRTWSRKESVLSIDQSMVGNWKSMTLNRVCENLEIEEGDVIYRGAFCSIATELFPFTKNTRFYNIAFDKISKGVVLSFKDLLKFYTEMSTNDLKRFICYLIVLHRDETDHITEWSIKQIKLTLKWMIQSYETEIDNVLDSCCHYSNEGHIVFGIVVKAIEKSEKLSSCLTDFLIRFKPI